MKKLLSSILALTLFFNSTVGYCENVDMNSQLLVSAEIDKSAQSNDTKSDADAPPSNIKFEIATKFHKLVPYLKEKIEQCKIFINKKVKEQRINSITEKQKEFQDLQSMSTSQYVEHCIKKISVEALRILALFWGVVVPSFIISLNKGYKEGQLKGKESGEKIINDAIEKARKFENSTIKNATKIIESANENAGEIINDANKNATKIINNAKEDWAPEDPLLLKTYKFLNLFTDTFDGISNSSILDAFVANAKNLTDKLYDRTPKHISLSLKSSPSNYTTYRPN